MIEPIQTKVHSDDWMCLSYRSGERSKARNAGHMTMKGHIYVCSASGSGLCNVADLICELSTRGGLEGRS